MNLINKEMDDRFLSADAFFKMRNKKAGTFDPGSKLK